VLVIQNHLNVRAIIEKHLPAVAAWREQAVQGFVVGGHNRVKLPLPRGYGGADRNIFRTRAMNTITVDAEVYVAVFTADRSTDRMVVYSVVKVFF
jgi:hypothetical protein